MKKEPSKSCELPVNLVGDFSLFRVTPCWQTAALRQTWKDSFFVVILFCQDIHGQSRQGRHTGARANWHIQMRIKTWGRDIAEKTRQQVTELRSWDTKDASKSWLCLNAVFLVTGCTHGLGLWSLFFYLWLFQFKFALKTPNISKNVSSLLLHRAYFPQRNRSWWDQHRWTHQPGSRKEKHDWRPHCSERHCSKTPLGPLLKGKEALRKHSFWFWIHACED